MSIKRVTLDDRREWSKSSYSTPDGAACVEVALAPSVVRIRDSKTDRGPHLVVGPRGWAAFVRYAAGN